MTNYVIAIAELVEEFLNENNIEGIVETFPSEVDIEDTDWHFYVDIENISYKKHTSNTYIATFNFIITIAKQALTFNEFISEYNVFHDALISRLFNRIHIDTINVNDLFYDTKNNCGVVNLVATVGGL